ncbi:MAG: hypothetical protein H7Y03_09285 [Chitinophagaceae bacterium]|nr:hypothetical protein [Chitinophagaceae bacterium]
MFRNINIKSLKKVLVCLFLATGITAISFASVGLGGGGGGGEKSKGADNTSLSSLGLSHIRSNNGFSTNAFTLKASRSYKSSALFSDTKKQSISTVNTVVTYQKGNTTYILPYKHRVSIAAAKSNLQAVNVKVYIRR